MFLKSGFLSQSIGRNVNFNILNKMLKKTRRNSGFTFSPEASLPLIDSPMMLCNFAGIYRCEEPATQTRFTYTRGDFPDS